jgi:type II secretory pathway pseudopilin PulG
MVVCSIIAILAGIAVPQVLAAVTRARTAAAARYVASRMAVARSRAVMHGTSVALRFEGTTPDVTFQMFADGNFNGVRTADIAAGIDRSLDARIRLRDLYPGVDIATTPDIGEDPVAFGASDLASFSPLGSASPGSIYVRGRDGAQFAVRVLGATGRARVERYVPYTKSWGAAF